LKHTNAGYGTYSIADKSVLIDLANIAKIEGEKLL